MDPNTQPPAAPTPPNNFNSSQFDFIMNGNQKPKKSLLPTGSPKQRLILMVAGGAIGLIIVILLFAVIFSGGSSNTDQFVSIARDQNEIVRVATLGNSKAGGTEAKKLAAITTSTVSSDQKKTLDYLAKQGKKVSPKDLAKSANSTTDADLTAAERNGRFDEVFTRILLQELAEYQANLKSAYSSAGKSGKEILDQNYNNVVLILNDNK